VDDLRGRQELYNGFGDTLARGFEIAVIPILFGAFGWFLDRRLGTMPLLTIVLAVFALVAMAVRTYFAYDAEMRAHEATSPWGRSPRSGPDSGGHR
jgi:hypothetical protein